MHFNKNRFTLKKIATSGGGKYFEVRTLDELKQSLETVAAQQMTSQSFTFKNAETPLYQHFTLAALLLFAAAAFIRLVLLTGTNKDRAGFQPGSGLQHFIYADTHRAEPKKRTPGLFRPNLGKLPCPCSKKHNCRFYGF